MRNYRFVVKGLVMLAIALSLGCMSKEADPLRADGRIVVGANVNPGYEGQPSPVVLRIYQLKAPGLFKTADFYALYNDGKATLGEDLLAHEQLDVRPGDILSYQRDWDDKTRYIGVLAAFRDIEKANWHAVTAVPAEGTVPLMIQVNELSVKLTLASEY